MACIVSEPKFIVMGVKAIYDMGLKSAHRHVGCPYSDKCLFKDIRSALTPSLPLLRTLPYPICCLANKQIDTNVLNQQERSSPLHSFPFVVGGG
jgi:hypothetical protein